MTRASWRARSAPYLAERPLIWSGLACLLVYAVISRLGDLDHRRWLLAAVVLPAWLVFGLAARWSLRTAPVGDPSSGTADPAADPAADPIADLAAGRIADRARARARLVIVVLLAACCQLPGVLVSPQSSSDSYRYVWDGRVQLAGTSPYRYVPLDDRLARLRDPVLFPGLSPSQHSGVSTLRRLPTDPGQLRRLSHNDPRTRINRPAVPTIYPPVAQVWFTTVAWLTPWSWGTTGLQLGAALLAVALTAALGLIIRRRGGDPALAMCWGWCPLVVLEAGNGAHVDVLAAVLVVAGFVVLDRDRLDRDRLDRDRLDRDRLAGWAPRLIGGLLLGLAAATKIIPLLLLPAVTVLRRRRGGGSRELAVPVTAIGSFVLSYLPHVLAVGALVIGYLPGYLGEEGFSDGDSRYAVIGLLLPPRQRQLVALTLAAALAGYALWRCDLRRPERTGVWLFGAAVLITTPAYDWYCLPLVALAVLAGRLEWLAVAAAAYGAYTGFRVPHVLGLSYALAGLVVLVVTIRRHRSADDDLSAGPTSQMGRTPLEIG